MVAVTAALSGLLGAGAALGILTMATRGGVRLPQPTPQAFAQAAIAIGAAAVVGILTRWPVGAALAGLGAWALPRALAKRDDTTSKIEAIATWAEMLRDTLAAAAGLQQAILATAPIAPAPIKPEVVAMADRIERGERSSEALRELARDLADPTGDLVAIALIQATERRAGHLGQLLSSLAAAARDQATMRLRVAASRARIRTSVRVIIGITLLMAGLLVALNRDFLSAYNTAEGQGVLLVVGACFAASFAGLHRMSRIDEPERILA